MTMDMHAWTWILEQLQGYISSGDLLHMARETNLQDQACNESMVRDGNAAMYI